MHNMPTLLVGVFLCHSQGGGEGGGKGYGLNGERER